ncbi:trypsin-like peptidase domain-containing protein [Flavobacteriales bacterium]|nr:trypsin-like peptidase domain-containing protein [Flavobacteriales bacterium]
MSQVQVRLTPILLVLLLAAGGSGCSVLNFTTEMDVMATSTLDSVRVYQDAGLTSDGVNWGERGIDSVQLELANVEPYHLVRFECDGHLPDVVPVLPARRNPLKWVDAGLTVAGIAAIAVGIPGDQTGLIVGGFFTAFYNALGLLFPPKKVYAKTLEGPALLAIPIRREGQPLVDMHTVDLAIDSGNYEWTYYEDYSAYLEGRDNYLSGDEDAIKLTDSNLDAAPRQLLIDHGFLPESNTLFSDVEKGELSCAIEHVMEHRAGGMLRYDVKTAWAIHNPYAMATDTVRITSSSTWSGFVIGEGLRRDLLNDCLLDALVTVIDGETDLNWEAETSRDVEAEWKADWDTLGLVAQFGGERRISETLDAVVTVTSEGGHGSGCILASEGWIVTNHHVVDDTTAQYEVHFADGTSLPANIVRWDPVVDVALLKVDTTGLSTLALRPTNDPVDIGDAVYAVGTPYDQGLDATVTRGIISSRRGKGMEQRLQTDVSISPGNSGGALLDEQGRWLGVVNAKLVAMDVDGIGFAIPVEALPRALRLKLD